MAGAASLVAGASLVLEVSLVSLVVVEAGVSVSIVAVLAEVSLGVASAVSVVAEAVASLVVAGAGVSLVEVVACLFNLFKSYMFSVLSFLAAGAASHPLG